MKKMNFKNISIKTSILTISCCLSVSMLTACHSGATNNLTEANYNLAKNIVGNSPLQQEIKNNLLTANDTTSILNLSNSLFLEYGKEYNYTIKDSKLNNIVNGSLKCNNPNDCFISTNLPDTSYGTYLLEIKQGSSFIGGATFMKTSAENQEISIDTKSTSALLAYYANQWIPTSTLLTETEKKIYTNVLNYRPNYTISDARYFYYIFLTSIKQESHEKALDTMKSIYTTCLDSSQCTVNQEFLINTTAVEQAEQAMNDAISKYLKDKSDSALADSYDWYEKNIKDKMGTAFDGAGAIAGLFPGSGGSTKDTIDKVKNGAFSIIDKAFDFFGLADSKAAKARIETFNTNLTKVYQEKTPDISDTVAEMLKIMQTMATYQVMNDFNKNFMYVDNSYATINSNLVEGNSTLSIDDYLVLNRETKNIDFNNVKYSWIIKNGNYDDGLFDSFATENRINSLNALTEQSSIKAYAELVKSASNNLEKKAGVNSIDMIHRSNAVLSNNLLKTINTLQKAEYIDNIGLILIERSKYKDNFKGGINLMFTTIGKVSLSGNYDKDAETMARIYKVKSQSIVEQYYQYIEAEKKYVPTQVMQTLEQDGKCFITYSDGFNKIGAYCPYYSHNDKNQIISQLHYSELDKPSSGCLTIEQDGSGDLMKIASIKNFGGKIACRINAEDWLRNTTHVSAQTLEPAEIAQDQANLWYLGNDQYFYPGSRFHTDNLLAEKDYKWVSNFNASRFVFLSNPNGEFKFKSLDSSELKSDLEFINDSSFDMYDPSGNLIGEFKTRVTGQNYYSSIYSGTGIPKEVMTLASLYNNCDTSSIISTCHSSVGDYSFKSVPVMRPADYTFNDSSTITSGNSHYKLYIRNTDYLTAVQTPDGKFKIEDIPTNGGWHHSCSTNDYDKLSNGYWAVAKKCGDNAKKVKSSVFGNGHNRITNCSNQDGILKCDYQ